MELLSVYAITRTSFPGQEYLLVRTMTLRRVKPGILVNTTNWATVKYLKLSEVLRYGLTEDRVPPLGVREDGIVVNEKK